MPCQPAVYRLRHSSRVILLATLAALTFASPALAQVPMLSPQTNTTEQQVVQASKDWFNALTALDFGALDRIQTDDFVAIQPGRGAVAMVNKADHLANLRKARSGRPVFERELSLIRVRQYDKIAILTALATYRPPAPRQPAGGSQAVISEVWVNEGGRWRLAHVQLTDVPAQSSK